MKENRVFSAYVYVFIVAFLFFALSSNAQVESLEGRWVISAGVERAEYSVLEIDSKGNATFTESYPYSIDDQEYIFDVNHTGKFTYSEDRQFAYAGVGLGEARESGGTVRVRLQVVAGGMGSADDNILVGVWANTEIYTTPEGQVEDDDGLPLTLTREGYDPGSPGEEIAGTWEITLQGENIDWTGQVTLNPDGTMLGSYIPEGSLSEVPIPLAGFFSYSETNQFEFSYTTTAELPVVGETTFTLSGQGQGNDDNTQITGTWAFTVQVTELNSRTFEGTFELDKIEDSDVPYWVLFH